MNRFRLVKFMLLTVALWLGFAVSSPGQSSSCIVGNQGDNWNNDCTSGPPHYQLNSNVCTSPCTLTVGQSGQLATSQPIVCVTTGTTIAWATTTATQGFIVQFGTNTPLEVSSTDATAVTLVTGSASPQGGYVPNSAGTSSGVCYVYAIAYCSPGQACVVADPKVIVSCPTGSCGGNATKK
jgi:hypothetical protein